MLIFGFALYLQHVRVSCSYRDAVEIEEVKWFWDEYKIKACSPFGLHAFLFSDLLRLCVNGNMWCYESFHRIFFPLNLLEYLAILFTENYYKLPTFFPDFYCLWRTLLFWGLLLRTICLVYYFLCRKVFVFSFVQTIGYNVG